MIISVWVFFMLGDSVLAEEHRTAYVQHIVPPQVHSTDWRREEFENLTRSQFEERYPGHVVTDSGWTLQTVEVMES